MSEANIVHPKKFEAEPLSGRGMFGIGAEFATAAELLAAVKGVTAAGYKWWDTHTPVPVHGIDRARGAGKSWVSAVALLGGITGLVTALLLQFLPAIERPEFLDGIKQGWFLDLFYPIVTSGKPYFDLGKNFPITAVLTIQLTGYAAFVGFLLFTFLPRLYNPIFNWETLTQRGSDNAFLLAIESCDPRFDEKATVELLEKLGGRNITRIPALGADEKPERGAW